MKIRFMRPFQKGPHWSFCPLTIWYSSVQKPDYLYGMCGIAVFGFGIDIYWT